MEQPTSDCTVHRSRLRRKEFGRSLQAQYTQVAGKWQGIRWIGFHYYFSFMFQRLILLTFALGVLLTASLYAQSSAQPDERSAVPYQFPKVAITGTMTVQEAWKRSQIPDDVLKRLTTEALLQSCLKFPFLMEIYASNSVQKGFTFQHDNFNGLQEFFKRPDAAATMLKLYQRLRTADAATKASPAEGGRFSFELSFVEIFLAQREMLRQLSGVERKALAAECLTKYDEKQLVPKAYDGLSLVSTGFVMARLLESQQRIASLSSARSLLDEGTLDNLNSLAEIYNQTKAFAEGK